MRWELLSRYVAGECTIAERASVERWLAESPARHGYLEQLTKRNPADTDARKTAVRARLERELGPGLKLEDNGL